MNHSVNNYPKRKDLLSFLLFIFIWIIPITYTGLSNKDMPFFPRTLCYLQRIAMLFTHSIESWPVYYIQVKLDDGKQWITLKEEDYFRLKPFGYRSRLHQILYYSKDSVGFPKGKEKSSERQREMAFWIAKKFESLHPQRSKVDAVRFVVAFYHIQKASAIKGRWIKPPLGAFPAEHTLVLSTHQIK